MQPEKPRRYLVAVGIETYDDPGWGHLKTVPAEIKRMVDLLTSSSFGITRILKEESEAPHSKDSVTALAEWAISLDRRETDQLILYWSGHGVVDAEQLLLVLENTKRATLKPALHVQQIVEAVLTKRSRIRTVLLMLDVCYAGQGGLDIATRLGALMRSMTHEKEPQPAGPLRDQLDENGGASCVCRSF